MGSGISMHLDYWYRYGSPAGFLYWYQGISGTLIFVSQGEAKSNFLQILKSHSVYKICVQFFVA